LWNKQEISKAESDGRNNKHHSFHLKKSLAPPYVDITVIKVCKMQTENWAKATNRARTFNKDDFQKYHKFHNRQ
jgi:hypothetical protein